MPFSSWFKKGSNGTTGKDTSGMNKEDKLQVTLKCMQSQQTTEPVYDVSGCNISYVPDQSFTYCKLLRKTSLLLYDNNLTDLEGGGELSDLITIKFLDIHNNRFSKLPNEIGEIKNLVRFDVSNNALETLPNSIANLLNLKEINLSNNKFSKVPKCLSALPQLHTLLLVGNKIKDIPSNMHSLQSSLKIFKLDITYLKEPYKSFYNETAIEDLMRHLCSEAGVEYTGVIEIEQVEEALLVVPREDQDDDHLTAAMVNYMQKKRQMAQQQLAFEKEREGKDASELDLVFKKHKENTKQIFSDVGECTDDAAEYEIKKQRQQQLHIELEKHMRQTQDEEVGAYLANTTSKENMLEDVTAQLNVLDRELEGIVEVKDSERHHLINDLHAGEKNIEVVMQEIINAAANKNATFISLLEEQDNQMEELLSAASDALLAEERKSEVVSAMQEMLAEAVMLEARTKKGGQKMGWISSLIEESEHSDLHVKDLLSSRQEDFSAWSSMLLHDQECQAAAFKLLLLNNDLKRSNILRQINQVEQELVRLSSLELRKTLLSVQHGSTTMLNQRKSLVELLKGLLSQKSEREEQLEKWLERMEDIHDGGGDAADYWLVQYQRLMDAKPSGLARAEEELEPAVVAVLGAARALDVSPMFARQSITFSRLLDLTREEADEMGVGPATYNSIQCALQHHLASVKLVDSKENEERVPSAPLPEWDEHRPSIDVTGASKLKGVDDENDKTRIPSAPPIRDCFVEAECVVCLERVSTVVLLPCGHVCACGLCAVPLSACPMCRADIQDKLVMGDA